MFSLWPEEGLFRSIGAATAKDLLINGSLLSLHTLPPVLVPLLLPIPSFNSALNEPPSKKLHRKGKWFRYELYKIERWNNSVIVKEYLVCHIHNSSMHTHSPWNNQTTGPFLNHFCGIATWNRRDIRILSSRTTASCQSFFSCSFCFPQ